jgi:cysteine synthase A
VLADRLGVNTIPQIFIGGHHMGGCTDLFEAVRSGAMQERMKERGIAWDTSVDVDPYALLPKWLQPRKSA